MAEFQGGHLQCLLPPTPGSVHLCAVRRQGEGLPHLRSIRLQRARLQSSALRGVSQQEFVHLCVELQGGHRLQGQRRQGLPIRKIQYRTFPPQGLATRGIDHHRCGVLQGVEDLPRQPLVILQSRKNAVLRLSPDRNQVFMQIFLLTSSTIPVPIHQNTILLILMLIITNTKATTFPIFSVMFNTDRA